MCTVDKKPANLLRSACSSRPRTLPRERLRLTGTYGVFSFPSASLTMLYHIFTSLPLPTRYYYYIPMYFHASFAFDFSCFTFRVITFAFISSYRQRFFSSCVFNLFFFHNFFFAYHRPRDTVFFTLRFHSCLVSSVS